MKTVGLLGGMSWESTARYYQWLNEGVKARLGGLHSARVVLLSVDFHEIEILQSREDWEGAARLLTQESLRVQAAGADLLLLCTNTMHKVADQIQASLDIPLLHIADATAAAIGRAGLRRVALLGTRFTMEEEFYRGRLERAGLQVLTPEPQGRERVHQIIYQELCLGEVRESSRSEYVAIAENLVEEGAQAVIAGCTEISMLLRPEDLQVPLFDTAAIHVEEALRAALEN